MDTMAETRNGNDDEMRDGTDKDGNKEKFAKNLTVLTSVEGGTGMKVIQLLRAIKSECGQVVGCRQKEPGKYEITMETVEGKEKLMDGLRLGDVKITSEELCNKQMIVSFLNLPVYIEDGEILSKLAEWGVKPKSNIKRRVWPGTEVADGTRFLKVEFSDEVRSLPYSTRFNTAEGAQYFRVIHDRQVRVCRLCIQPGHMFRECPEFKCHRCGEQGHYARECGWNEEREERGESGGEEAGGRGERDKTGDEERREGGRGQDGDEEGGDGGQGERGQTGNEERGDGEGDDERMDDDDDETEETEEEMETKGKETEESCSTPGTRRGAGRDEGVRTRAKTAPERQGKKEGGKGTSTGSVSPGISESEGEIAQTLLINRKRPLGSKEKREAKAKCKTK